MGYTSLFFRERDLTPGQAEETAAAVLQNFGYTRFDPFSGIPGRAYPQTTKLFIAPPLAGWVRVLAEAINDDIVLALSEKAGLVYARLEGSQGSIDAWRDRAHLDLQADYDITAEKITVIQPPPKASGDWMDALPDEIKAMQKHPQQAAKMIDRLSGSLLAKAGGGDQREQAMALLSSDTEADWSSAAGKTILSTLAALGIQNGISPDFATLRDAYALHARRKRRPGAKLLPGDENTLESVPNALQYLPVYAGKG